jgi:hypothetical protein
MVDYSTDQLLRKITVKDVMRGVKYKEDLTEQKDLFVVYGFTEEMRSEESGFKDQSGNAMKYNRYFGAFKAKRIGDGKQFRSTQLILDNFSSDLLALEFHTIRKDDEGAPCNFAYIIGVEPFVRGEETKYRHTLKPVNMYGDELPDPLAAIEARMLENMPQEFLEYFEASKSDGVPAIEDKRAKPKA